MSAPKRFFVDKLNYPAETVVRIEGEEFVHAKTVLRIEEGAEIILLDGSGKEYSAIVAKIEKHALSAHITGVKAGDKEPKTPIYLLCGALKGDKTEFVVQKSAELGVSKIGVFSSEYCSAYMNENKLERLRKVAREAAKQCLRSCAPEIEYFDSLEKALKSAEVSRTSFLRVSFCTVLPPIFRKSAVLRRLSWGAREDFPKRNFQWRRARALRAYRSASAFYARKPRQ